MTPRAALDDIFKAVDQGIAPGLVVGVAQRGKTLYRRGFGLASIEHAVANTPKTRMRLASVTKHFTCLAALLLAEEGKLDIDAPATRILPELPLLQGMPTLRQFMTHTSGHRCFMELAYVAGLSHLAVGEGLATLFRQSEVSFPPGASQLYNNGGYELLSEAIARASGMSFECFLRERVFEPLGMHDTASVPNDMMLVPGIATFHTPRPEGGWRRGITPIDDNRGAGAIVTTIDDMLRWLAHLRGPDRTVGSDDSWRQMTTPATLNNGLATTYALGLNRHDYRGVEVLHHGGGLVGVGSQMLTVPSHGLDIIIMTNGALVSPVDLGWQIVDALLGDQLVGSRPPLVPAADYAHLFGAHYHSRSGMLYGFGDAGGHLGLRFLHSPPLPVLRDRGEIVSLRMEEAGLGPIEIRKADLQPASDGGAPATLAIGEAGNWDIFKRLPPKPPAQVGKPLMGRYRSPDLGAEAEFRVDGGSMQLRIFGGPVPRDYAAEALTASIFGLTSSDPQMPGFCALTAKRRQGRVTGFHISSGRVRKLWFERLPS